jgi:hypothetical protein
VTDLVVHVEEEDEVSAPVVAPVATVDIASIQAAVSPAVSLARLLRGGEEVVLNFTYTKKSGVIRTVKNFVANEIRGGYKELILGEREDGKIRSYLLHRMSDIEILSKQVTPVALKDTFTTLAISVDTLKNMVAGGAVVTVDFNYTTVTGESRTVKNFEADGISRDLLVGTREEDGETRRYRLDNITNVVMLSSK